MSFLWFLGLVFLLFSLAAHPACTSTPAQPLTPLSTGVEGLIKADTTWSASRSPYIVTVNLLVARGATLAIEPGVEVRFRPGLSLRVEGALVARGTSAAPIRFTSNTAEPGPGDWGSIRFGDSSVDASYDAAGNYRSGSILEHCLIEFAGAGGGYALRFEQSGPLVRHCAIRDNAGSGISVQSGTPKIQDNTITGNRASGDGGGIYVNLTPFRGSTTLSGNTIMGNASSGNGGGIYIVNLSGAVTLSGNTVMGNMAEGDGAGVYIATAYGSISSLSRNTIARNTAAGDGGGMYLSTSFDGASALTGNTIQDNVASGSGGAVYIESSSASVLMSGNIISGNVSSGLQSATVHLQGDQRSKFSCAYNQLGENHAQYLFYSGFPNTAPPLNLQHNWWGTEDEAQIQAGIYDRSDDNRLVQVDYSPWLRQPPSNDPVSQ